MENLSKPIRSQVVLHIRAESFEIIRLTEEAVS